MTRNELNYNYARAIVEGWDMDTLWTFAVEQLESNISKMPYTELMEEIEQDMPELLENA